MPACGLMLVGLSPRGRGNPNDLRRSCGVSGSIPAWAGKPAWWGLWDSITAVYPRVGGETKRDGMLLARYWGLSPRGRGNPVLPVAVALSARSIPAWAGKPSMVHLGQTMVWVYPRVGGETSSSEYETIAAGGLSPRGRGNHHSHTYSHDHSGSIPAWAGKPQQQEHGYRSGRVYPRVGGETLMRNRLTFVYHGLSPRGRGNRTR